MSLITLSARLCLQHSAVTIIDGDSNFTVYCYQNYYDGINLRKLSYILLNDIVYDVSVSK